MIDLYSWPTPNGHKVHIMLEECGLDYTVHAIDIGAGAQFEPDFLKFSPNNKMPALIDTDGPGGKPYSVFESGAMLMYLAEKTGKFMPSDMAERYTVIQWLMFQMGGVGPMLGQAHHFAIYAPRKIKYAIDRYNNETRRLYNVVDRRLGEVEYVAGAYSIADMAIYPWMRLYERYGIDIETIPNFKRWLDAISERPAVQRGVEILEDRRRNLGEDSKARELLFGAQQYARR